MIAWKIFVLGVGKMPLPNCSSCSEAGPEHDREACSCLTCHGIYAATDDPARIREMQSRYPSHPWAVRCGEPSGIVVIDAEGTGSPSGVDVLEGWETWLGWPLQPATRVAVTPSGGVHLYYAYVPGVRSRNRVLPNIDIKSDGGYVVIPTAESSERRWLLEGDPGQPDDRLVDWLRGARGRSAGGLTGVVGHSEGYDFDRFLREGCPGGSRDEFFNDLIFRLRKAGLDRAALTMRVREQWHRAAQPPEATWYMPWWNCEYKIEKVWRTVAPDPEPGGDQLAWARSVQSTAQVGRVTLAPRGGR